MCRFCENAKADLRLSFAEKIAAEECSVLASKRRPCVILTGMLGSGKSTALMRVLETSTKKIAVVENEVGEVSIDDKLVKSKRLVEAANEVVMMPNGCMCCRVRGDLVDTFKRLIGQVENFDGIVLELSGLSNLGPVVQTFFSDSFVQRSLKLDSVICIVDASTAENFILCKDEVLNVNTKLQAGLIREQLSLADSILVNKIDLLREEKNIDEELEGAIRSLNSHCTISFASLKGESTLPKFLSSENFLNANAFSFGDVSFDSLVNEDQHEHGHRHYHDQLGYGTASFRIPKPIDCEKLQAWLETNIFETCPDALVRYKGLIWSKNFGMDVKVVFQGVFGHMEFSVEGPIETMEEKTSLLVFIGAIEPRNLRARLERGLWNCVSQEEEDPCDETENEEASQTFSERKAALLRGEFFSTLNLTQILSSTFRHTSER